MRGDRLRGVGKGHGTRTPNLPVIRPMDLPSVIEHWKTANLIEANTRGFRMGKVRILVSRDPVHGWHISMSHPDRYPTWDEVAKVRYELIPNDVAMAMLLPPPEEYINIHETTFQLREVT